LNNRFRIMAMALLLRVERKHTRPIAE